MGDGEADDVPVGLDVESDPRRASGSFLRGPGPVFTSRVGAQVDARRVGGELSRTVPTTSAMCVPSVRWCSHVEPTCQSETLLWPQYSAVRSASVSACQICSGVLSM